MSHANPIPTCASKWLKTLPRSSPPLRRSAPPSTLDARTPLYDSRKSHSLHINLCFGPRYLLVSFVLGPFKIDFGLINPTIGMYCQLTLTILLSWSIWIIKVWHPAMESESELSLTSFIYTLWVGSFVSLVVSRVVAVWDLWEMQLDFAWSQLLLSLFV